MNLTGFRVILFDWGGTLMKDDPTQSAPSVEWPQLEMVAGADTLLADLRRSGRVTALATGAAVSSEAQIRGALAHIQLDRYFEKIYCFDTTGQRKPSKAFYQFILEDLKLQPAEALMVGDSFSNDVLAANQVGIAAIWLNLSTAENRNGADFATVHSLAELQARFKSAG